jgi:hypothetical protein
MPRRITLELRCSDFHEKAVKLLLKFISFFLGSDDLDNLVSRSVQFVRSEQEKSLARAES